MRRAWIGTMLLVFVCGTYGVCLGIDAQFTITGLNIVDSQAQSINNNGQVVGNKGSMSGFVWTAAGGYHSVSGSSARVYGNNNSGLIVGDVFRFDSQVNIVRRAIVWDANGDVLRELGTLSGGDDSYGRDINDSGMIVGRSYKSDNHRYAYWCTGSSLHSMGEGEALAANDNGQVVGYDEHNSPFIWTSSGGRKGLAGGYGHANDINNLGQVAGYSWTGASYLPALWDEDGQLHYLGTLGGWGHANSINESTQIVGYSYLSGYSGATHAFLYTAAAGLQDLNDLIEPDSGWVLSNATSINDLGQIVGYGTNPAGQSDSFLLTPVPEPATLSLLVLGGVAVFSAARRLRKA